MKKSRKKNIKQLSSEFDYNSEIYVIFAINNLMMGRMIAEHKGEYALEHQGELVIFNANIITLTHGKIWYGDINVTQDFDNLKNIADTIKEDLYILTEYDARWGSEDLPINELIEKARTVIKCKICQ